MICICRYDLTVGSSDFKSTPLFFPWYLCRVPPTGYFPNIPDWFRDPFCLSHNIWCSPSVNTQNDWTMTLYFFFLPLHPEHGYDVLSLEQNMDTQCRCSWMGKQEKRCIQRWGSKVSEGVEEKSMEGEDCWMVALHPLLLASLAPQATGRWRGKPQHFGEEEKQG